MKDRKVSSPKSRRSEEKKSSSGSSSSSSSSSSDESSSSSSTFSQRLQGRIKSATETTNVATKMFKGDDEEGTAPTGEKDNSDAKNFKYSYGKPLISNIAAPRTWGASILTILLLLAALTGFIAQFSNRWVASLESRRLLV